MSRGSASERRWRTLLPTVTLASALAACAPAAAVAPPAPSPEQVQALETRLAADSSDVATLVSLGQAYLLMSRPAEVVPLLERARSIRPDDADLALRLGVAYEDAGQLADALELYSLYAERGRDPRLRRQVEGRITVVRLRQLQEAARDALAREDELANTTPDPSAVAILPFLIQTQDSTLEPLGRALAEMLVTDLARTDRLTVLERTRVQMLVTEMRLAEQGLVDPTTAARSGRLLGAGRVVQGSVAGEVDALDLGAAIVSVQSGTPQVQSAQATTSLQRLFDAQKALALEIYRVLGVELTAAEREQVNRRPTENLRALLAFGLGLESEDVGAFERASRYYDQAASLDPAFDLARQRAAEAARAADAAELSTAALWQLTNRQVVDALAEAEAMVPEMSGRDAVAELFGQEGLSGGGSVIRVILTGGGGEN